MHPKNISILDYTYDLPAERIAEFPLAERDASKLLVYKNGELTVDHYKNVAIHLPAKSLLVFNNTKVIQARILFEKTTGGVIEIFCLEPYETTHEYNTLMNKTGSLRWKCMIGGASKWKQGHLEKKYTVADKSWLLEARLVEKIPDAYIVQLSWQPAELSFAEMIDIMGDTPLPPYIKRKAGEADKERYQTVYAKHDGSVAAPTAGLHFTPRIFDGLKNKKIDTAFITLHVGAGTFKPVKARLMAGHEMHEEWTDTPVETIQKLISHLDLGIIAVGTTSVRTLESLYWMGVKTLLSPGITADQLPVMQWDVYEAPLADSTVTPANALQALMIWMKKNNIDRLFTPTQILIAPGYQFRIPLAIITNFHQPQSTLLLLVAALIGSDWRNVYDYALKNGFRFLSYGDGCLLFLPEKVLEKKIDSNL